MSDFLPLAQNFHDLVRAHDPAALVAGPGVVHVKWLEGFWDAGGTRDVDAVAFHGYPKQPMPEQLDSSKLAPLRAIAARYGLTGKPIWDSEGSWGEFKDLPDFEKQAAFVARY